jgi:hypothetical protein
LFDLYSLGNDGISETGGNDKDDINNWDPEKTWLYEAYGHKRRDEDKIWIVSAVLAGIVALGYVFYRTIFSEEN